MDSRDSSEPIERSFVVGSVRGRRVHGRITSPAGADVSPTLFALHGFRAHMDWGFFPDFARRAARRGYCVVRFSFSGSGVPPGDLEITDREAFARDSYGKQLQDLEAVHDAVDRGTIPEADPRCWSILGHSRGSGIGLIHAAERGDARAFVGWAQITTPGSWSPETKQAWRAEGAHWIPHGTDGGKLLLGLETLDDLEKQAARYDLEARAAELACPALLLHGDRDIAISADEARTLLEHFPTGRARLVEIPRTGHTFGVRHPMERIPPAYETLVAETLAFLDQSVPRDQSDGPS